MAYGFPRPAERAAYTVSLPVIYEFAYEPVVALAGSAIVIQPFPGIFLNGNSGVEGNVHIASGGNSSFWILFTYLFHILRVLKLLLFHIPDFWTNQETFCIEQLEFGGLRKAAAPPAF